MCYPVCGMVHIKEPLLLIGKSCLCGGSGFPLSLFEWSFIICLTPYNRAQVSAFAGSSVRDRKKKGEGVRGGAALAGTREYEQSDRNRKQAEGVLRCSGIWNVP